jgi:hypothetical protein
LFKGQRQKKTFGDASGGKISVLLSAPVKTFGVTCMRDFYVSNLKNFDQVTTLSNREQRWQRHWQRRYNKTGGGGGGGGVVSRMRDFSVSKLKNVEPVTTLSNREPWTAKFTVLSDANCPTLF